MENETVKLPLFPLGRTVITPGALATFGDLFGVGPGAIVLQQLLTRHVTGDWGDLDASDRRANDLALRDGERLFSSYNLPKGERVWIITEWDRSYTTTLLPDEY